MARRGLDPLSENWVENLPFLGELNFCIVLVYHSKCSLVSTMLKAYKYRIYPTKEQAALLAKSFGCVNLLKMLGAIALQRAIAV
jgi:hypothetical protein